MTTIDKLIEYFSNFPGIGPRQARRFVYFLLTRNPEYISEFTKLVLELRNEVHVCISCQRFFQSDSKKTDLCNICSSTGRDKTMLAIVSRDVDLENIEKAHFYNGLYFVLGGTVPILEKNPEKRVRSSELQKLLGSRKELKEIILAMNATADGDNTADYIESFLRQIISEKNIKITHLGKGISTGTELEYSDPETIKNALKNRQ